jgi:hypothetical protein
MTVSLSVLWKVPQAATGKPEGKEIQHHSPKESLDQDSSGMTGEESPDLKRQLQVESGSLVNFGFYRRDGGIIEEKRCCSDF